jgi:PDZ domain
MDVRILNRGIAMAWFSVAAACASAVSAQEDRKPASAPAEASTIEASTTETEQSSDAEPPTPSPDEIASWIRELDDDQYLVRERATGELLSAGAVALDPLLETANGQRPEPADRAVWILRKLSTGEEPALRRPALERLTELEDRPQIAETAKKALSELRHAEAARAIKELGARYVTSQYPGPDRRIVVPQVVLDDSWRGGDEGLKHLADVQGVRQVMVIGTDISPDGLAALKHVAELESLWLYGTKLEPEDTAILQESLPHVTIDYRRGALLGVGPTTADGPGPATVATVQPASVAAAAGIRPGDVIEIFNGQKVGDFKDLTAKIAKHRAGDEVKLGLVRGGEKIDLTVKLGQWSAEQIFPHLDPQ